MCMRVYVCVCLLVGAAGLHSAVGPAAGLRSSAWAGSHRGTREPCFLQAGCGVQAPCWGTRVSRASLMARPEGRMHVHIPGPGARGSSVPVR